MREQKSGVRIQKSEGAFWQGDVDAVVLCDALIETPQNINVGLIGETAR
jgi:hypothetical protein